MDPRRVTNALLFVIAVCLVLMVIQLYGIGLAQPLEARQALSQQVELVYKDSSGTFHSLADQRGRIYIVDQSH